jgi:hypothetical protein
LLESIDDLAVVAANLEDAHPVGHQLDLREMLVEASALTQIRDRPADALKAHASLE